MPYITPDARHSIDQAVGFLNKLQTEGEVNYTITQIVDRFLSAHGLNYKNVNAMVGALECAKLELYRRIAAPYEDEKIVQNGDAYRVNKEQKQPVVKSDHDSDKVKPVRG